MGMRQSKINALENQFNGEELLHYERKRIGFFGLPFSFTKYYLFSKRLVVRTGLLRQKENEILLFRVLDTSITVTLLQRIFGLGTLKLITSDKTDPELIITNIKNVYKFKNTLSSRVESERQRLRFRTGEFVDNNDDIDNNDFDEDIN